MNIPDKINIAVVCLFCGAALEGPENAVYSSGDLIKCAQCGEGNDYDSVVEVAKEKGMEQLKGAVQGAIKETFKGLLKR